MENFKSAMMQLGVLFFIVFPVIHIVVAIFLNKFHELVYGEGTFLGLLPVVNIYLLGKLTINKTFGWILIACVILEDKILPDSISSSFSKLLYGRVLVILFIYGIIKYYKLKRESNY